MRILVTGANGFVGQALCRYLLAAGHEVRGAVRRAGTPLPEGVELAVVGEIGRKTDWATAMQGVETVVHLAARVHVMHDPGVDPLTMYGSVNAEGTLRLAQQASAAGVHRLVFVSSIKVNGEGRDVPYTEADQPAPEDPYAVSKWRAELGLMRIAEDTGLEMVFLRPPLVYGPGVKGNFAELVRWIRKGVPLPFGALQNRRSLLALDNLVSFIALCADPGKSPKAANQVFLISDGEDVSTAELVRRVAQAYGTKARLIPVPPAWMWFGARLLGKTAVADRLLGSLVIDSSKARELLGWQPVVTMDEQLRKMASDAAPV